MRKITSLLVVLFCLFPLWQTFAQEGNTCSDPIEIASLPYSTTDDTADYTSEYSGPPGTGCGTASQYLSGKEAIYAYTATYTGELALTMNPEDTYAGFFVYNNCSDIGVVCASDGYAVNGNSTSELDIMISVESGETYYIVVSMWADGDLNSFAYTLDVEEVSCSRPGLVTLESVGFEETIISWEGNAESYEYVLSTNSTEPTAAGTVTTETEVVFENLTEGQTYYFWVRSLCEDDDVSAWANPVFFRSPGQGDTCGAAIEIASLPFTVEGNTSDYANEYTGTPGASCGTTNSYLDGNNVVYAYTATANTAVQILLESTAGNKGVFVYDDCESIGSLCNVGAVESSGSQDLVLDLYVETGETYYILLSTWPAPQTMSYTLSIDEITCAVPGSISLDGATPTTANFSWSGLDEADSYDYSISTSQAVPTAETGNTTDSSIALTDLTPDTNYYFRVRTVCGDTATDWSEPFHFFTGYCTPNYSSTIDYLTDITTDGGFIDINYSTDSKPANGYDNQANMQVVVAPGMEFDMTTTYQGGMNTVKVWVDWNSNMAFETAEVVYDHYSSDLIKTFTIEVPADIEPGNYRLRVASRYGNNDIEPCGTTYTYGSAVDFTLVVGEEPDCMPVTELTVEAISFNEIIVSWEGPDNADTWEVEYVANNGPQGSGVTETATTNSITIDGLEGDTDYSIYVTPVCEGEDGLTRSTTIFTGYCTPTYTSTSDYLAEIETENAINNISYSVTSRPTNGYDNQAHQSIIAFSGSEIDFSTRYVGGGQGIKVWIDSNNNLLFDEDEVVYFETTTTANQNGTIEVPSGLEPGNYRIRFVSVYGSSATINDACGTYTYGSTVDFTLTIVELDCMPATDISFASDPDNNIIMSWTGNDDVAEWEIEYGVRDFTEGEGTTVTTGDTSYLFTDLVLDTEYDFYIKGDCADEDGITIGPKRFFFGYCIPTTQYSEHLTSIVTEGALADIDYSSPTRPTGGYDNQSETQLTAFAGSQIDIATVYSSGSNGVNVWVDLDYSMTFEDDEKLYSNFGNNAAQSGVLSIPSDLAVGTYRMRVRGQYGSSANPPPCGQVSYGSTVDFTLNIVELDCMPATDISFSADQSNHITMSWTGNDDVLEWEIEYGVTGFTQGQGTIVTTTDTSYLFTNLELDTEYDFYIKGDCADEEGLTVGPKRFYFGFCTPTSSSGEYLASITTEGGFINLDYSAASQPSQGYDNQTDTQLVILAGAEVDIATVYSSGANGVNAWIDWDNSLTFEDSEKVYTNMGSNAAQGGSLDFPEDINPGTYRMRVRGQWGSTANPPACGQVTWGSAVDFTLVVLDPGDCLPPLEFETTAVYMDAIEFTWVDNAENAESWEIEYGRRGFIQGQGTVIQTDTKPVLIEGLDSSSSADYAEYDFYVRAICSGEETGSWSPFPHREATLCGPTTVPYILDFEASVTPDIPPCTSQQVFGNSNAWHTEFNPGYYLGETTVLRYDRSATDAADSWFFTGGVELEAGEWYTISYDYMIGNPQFAESFKVAMGESANAAAMTTVLSDYPEITVGNVTQDEVEFRVDSDGVYYFGFHIYSDAAQFAFFLDNIKIDYSLGVEDMEEITFTMYPNPASSDVQVQSSNTMQRITVYNILGQTVENVKPMDTSYNLNVESLQTGTYLLEVEADGKRQTKRLIKK